MADRITAVFDNEKHAEMAVRDLRDMGITDDRLSIVARHHEDKQERRDAGERRDTGESAARRLADEGVTADTDMGARDTDGGSRDDADYRGEGDVSEAARGGDEAGGAGRGAAVGAGVGALFGLAASLIPGVGPFITAGFLANLLGATAGGVASGAIVGGTAGAVSGALARAGYGEDESRFYGDAVEKGGTMVAVDMTDSAVSHDQVRDVLSRHGGRFHGEEAARRAA